MGKGQFTQLSNRTDQKNYRFTQRQSSHSDSFGGLLGQVKDFNYPWLMMTSSQADRATQRGLGSILKHESNLALNEVAAASQGPHIPLNLSLDPAVCV